MSEAEQLSACAGCTAGSTTSIDDLPASVDRRGFLVQSAILAAAAALAACGASGDATAPTVAAGSTVKVSDYSSLSSVGGIAMVTVSGAPLAIVRTGTNSFLALSRVCPHEGTIVNQNGSGFLCPRHGAQFSQTGTWVGGQRTSSLHSYATTYDAASGTLTIG